MENVYFLTSQSRKDTIVRNSPVWGFGTRFTYLGIVEARSSRAAFSFWPLYGQAHRSRTFGHRIADGVCPVLR